jgi:choline dehydrogenase-like flavoprotein
LSDYELKCKDHDGFGENWPIEYKIEYKDVAPYYDRVEPILPVSGRNEGWPQSPDGVFIEDNSPDSRSIQRFKESAKRPAHSHKQGQACHGTACQFCKSVSSRRSTHGTAAIVANAVVREITIDRNTGLANGAHFIDRQTKQQYRAKARAVVLGASTLESTRILLNSRIANSSEVLGHYLFDQFISRT